MDTPSSPPYRFGFVIATGMGNQTRYLNLRKYAERDPSLHCVWAPNPGYLEPNPFRHLPEALRVRLTTLRLAHPVLGQLRQFDAVFFHAFEPYVLAALHRAVGRRPLLVWSKDDPPTTRADAWFHYGVVRRTARRAYLRFVVDCLCARRTDLFFPFSRWAGERVIEEMRVPRARVHAAHVGVDLELWSRVERAHTTDKPKILFVGADFVRKGGDLLLEVFAEHFADRAELHMVTKEMSGRLPRNVFVHSGLGPNEPRLRALYASASMLVLPTRCDLSPNVILEAMATGLPVIASNMAGIPEMVHDGVTGFLVQPEDRASVARRIALLLGEPALRQRMGAEARALVEREFDASVVVPRMLTLMKQMVDANGCRAKRATAHERGAGSSFAGAARRPVDRVGARVS